MLALDRSLRRYDQDGHLHVEMTNISKANVCGYLGREIPNSEALGLDPKRIYRLYRDPVELAKAAPTFEGKPLLLHHIPVTADMPAQELIVGSIGAPVVFKKPYLQGPISVWTREAIDAIETEEQRELSAAYRYEVDMRPGVTPDGLTYDGRMFNLKGNHLALVAEGRAGHDVVVADEVPRMRFKNFFTSLSAAFGAVLKPEQMLALDTALSEELAAEDAKLSDEEKKAACDAAMKELGKDSLSDEEEREAYKRAAKDKRAKDSVPAGPEGGAPKPGMDEAAVKLAVDAAVAKATEDLIQKADADKLALDAASAARAEVHALYAAREAVAPKVGVVALDSAEAVYRFALDQLKVEHKDVPVAAIAALYEASAKAPTAPVIAQDAAQAIDFRTLLGLSHIRKG